MQQCNFCTRTEDRVPGDTLWKGRLNSRICVDCALLVLRQTINRQDKEFRVLRRVFSKMQGREQK